MPLGVVLGGLSAGYKVCAQLCARAGDPGLLDAGDLDLSVPDLGLAGGMGELPLHGIARARTKKS